MIPQRPFRALHTWAGTLSGLLLFLVFCAGTLTLFEHELDGLTAPHTAALSPAEVEAFARELHRRHPELQGAFSLALPTTEESGLSAYWQAPDGTWVFTDPGALAAGQPAAPRRSLGAFVNGLHHNLGLGRPGSLLVTGISLLYALALLSGLVIQGARGLRRLLQVRADAGPRRFWGDLHGALGLVSLPFHLAFSLTGALFGGFMLLVATYDRPVFRGQLAPNLEQLVGTKLPAIEGAGSPALPLRSLLERTRTQIPGFEPAYVRFQHFGVGAAPVQIMGHRPGSLGRFGQVAVAADTGRLLDVQVPGHRDGNHALLATLYGLHFGDFGGLPVRLGYALLGLSGALLLLSGQFIWVGSRARTAPGQARFMARLTVGFAGGTLLGLALGPWVPPAHLLPTFWITVAIALGGAMLLKLSSALRLMGFALSGLLLGLALHTWPGDVGAPRIVALALALSILASLRLIPRLRGAWS